MAFGLKKKAAADEAPAATEDAKVATTGTKRAAGKKKKPQELLSSVVNESTVGAAIDVLKQNGPFALPNGSSWATLLLSADAIGGLSQKFKGDATKGSIIELIAADKIQVVATKDMLDEEFFAIVPTADTLARMDEYQLLINAPYHWVVLDTEDGGATLVPRTLQDVPASYADAVAIAKGEKTLAAVMPQVWEWAGGATVTASAPQASNEPAFDDILVGASVGAATLAATAGIATIGDEDPLAGAFGFGDEGSATTGADFDYSSLVDEGQNLDTATGEVDETDEPALEFDAAAFEQQFANPAPVSPITPEDDTFGATWQNDDEETGDTDPADEGQAEGYLAYLAENQDRVVDEEEVRETIARRFLSNDLDLVVDTAEFEKVFGTAAPAITLEIAEDPSDWLGSQVAQISRQANAELEALHRGNTDELRELFVETMALHVEKTMSAVSTDAPGSQYHSLMEGAKEDFEAKRASAPQEISEARREITSRFDTAKQSRADQAAAHAAAVYDDKNRPKLERDLAEVGLDLDRRHEEQFAHDRQVVLDMRRRDALVRMDLGANRIFELLRERQVEQRAAERALLERWNGQLIQFIDENRKDDIARAMALAEELERTNAVDKLKREHRDDLKTIRRESAEREQALQAEQVRIRQAAVAELEAHRAAFTTSLQTEREQVASGRALVTQLQGQIGTLERKYEDQYKGRISTLEADKEAADNAVVRMHGEQKRLTFILIAVMVVLTVAGIAVGLLAGFSWGHSQTVQSNAEGLVAAGSLLL
jgi:hypothetical protein